MSVQKTAGKLQQQLVSHFSVTRQDITQTTQVLYKDVLALQHFGAGTTPRSKKSLISHPMKTPVCSDFTGCVHCSNVHPIKAYLNLIMSFFNALPPWGNYPSQKEQNNIGEDEPLPALWLQEWKIRFSTCNCCSSHQMLLRHQNGSQALQLLTVHCCGMDSTQPLIIWSHTTSCLRLLSFWRG